MAQLAILGHPTKKNEVITILKMLGGKTSMALSGDLKFYGYYINSDGFIDFKHHSDFNNDIIYSLEEFIEKFPYRVGDRVRVAEYESEVRINDMKWDGNEVQYEVFTDMTEWYSSEELNLFNESYKEETMENKPNLLQKLKEYFENTPREVVEKEWHEYDKYNEIGPSVEEYLEYVNNIRQPKYPKTYNECCEIFQYNKNLKIYPPFDVDIPNYNALHLFDLLEALRKLLICRDAYWKIAGEQMGLGKPWEPNWKDCTKPKYTIHLHCDGHIFWQDVSHTEYRWLSFSTAEMRDAFYKNFKDLIEQCKDFL